MKRLLLLKTLAVWLLLLIAPGAGFAQQASGRLECCADQPICAGETAKLLVALEGKAPFTFRYSDGTNTQTVSTSENLYTLEVSPGTTRQYTLVSMQDAKGAGQSCGTATVAVNQCQPPKSGKDCTDNCFSSQVLTQKKQGSCTTYTLQVNNDGSCQSALSHFSISIPCGQVSQASNSKGWPMEIGTTDPTTGITGIKVDNIKGFGEDGKAGSFTVTYTVCASSCGGGDPLCGFLVAYKAGQCVNYGTATPPYQAMAGKLAATNVNCYGATNGSINLSLTGGQAPYIYSWSNGASTANLSNVAAGTYTVTITDAANKQLVLTTTITQPLALAIQANSTQASCGNSNGAIDLLVAGGTAPYTYNWSNGATTQDITALAAGTYTVTVTDAKGCTLSNSYSIATSSSMQLSLNGGSYGCSTSAITATINGGTAPYSYSWNTGAVTSSITPVSAGTYTLTVTDAAGCMATASTTTSNTGSAIALTYEYSSPACSGGRDGWIDLNVSGGSAPYTYSWSNLSTTEDLSDISSGAYNVTVTDANGCTATARISLPYTPSIGLTATNITQPDCLGNLGSITVSAFNGSAPYTYTWSNGATGQTIGGLDSGYYTVTVTDDMGCTSSRTFQVKDASSPQVQITGGACGNSTLTAVVSGGTGPYTYEWSNGATTGSITGVTGTYYIVVVTDKNGCTSEASIDVNEIGSSITLSTTSTTLSCAGAKDGNVDLTVSGGTGPYTYTWSNGTTTEDLTNVGAGTYSVTVTDASGCTKTATATISSPAAITITASQVIHAGCNSLGSLTISAQNGTAPYTYQWVGGQTSNSLDNLSAGTYSVMVTDAKGCTAQQSFTISQEATPTVSISSSGNCTTQQLTAQVTGGVGPYTYKWSNGLSSNSITPTVNGSYSVTITDSKGCTATAYTEVSLGENNLNLQASIQPVSCGGSSDGAATILASGGTAPYTFDWSNGLTTANGTNLATGVYSVKVTDAKGCYDVVAFEIKAATQIAISLASSTNSSCELANGSLSVAVNGGIAPYTYKWSNGATTASIEGLVAGTYTVAVIDVIGCSAEASFTIEGSAGSSVSAIMENCADMLLPVGATASLPIYFEGIAPYTFTYSNGITTKTVTTSSNPYVLQVQPKQTTTYTLTGVNSSCGAGSAAGKATITVVNPKVPVCTNNCFSSELTNSVNSGNCTTYTLQISADGSCAYELSHFQIALSCGNVSAMSNSEGWPMSVGVDPTTGVYGIKIDNIQGMGKSGSFTVTYTLCNTTSCIDTQNYCGPLVAYKAGQCVYYGSSTISNTPTVSLPEGGGVLGPKMDLKLYPNPVAQGQTLSFEMENLFLSGDANVTITSITGLKVHQSTVALAPDNNTARIALHSIPAGSYVLTVTLNGARFSKQLLIY